MPSGLTIHVAADLEQLTEVMAQLLTKPAGPPLAPEWTVVPSAAVRQWLDWRLGDRFGTTSSERSDGVSANLHYLFPEEFVGLIESAAITSVGDTRFDWDVESLTLELLSRENRGSYEVTRRLAEQIDELVRWRPDFINNPNDIAESARDALRLYHGIEPPSRAPLAQQELARSVLRSNRPDLLAERAILFGLANLPGGGQFASLVADLATHVEVHVLLPTCNLRAARELISADGPHEESPPLASWHQDGVETIELWRSVARQSHEWKFYETSPRSSAGTLSAFQHRLRGGEVQPSEFDGSIEVIGCVGNLRQVEVVRDRIFTAIGDGLRASQILVVTPDPSRLESALERHWNHERDAFIARPRLPYELTERSGVGSLDRLSCSSSLLELLGNYVTTSQLQHLCEFPAVRYTVGLSDAQWSRWWQLAEVAPITFGVSPQQRAPFGVYSSESNSDGFRADTGTWQRLCDRIVTAYVAPNGDDQIVADDLPIAAAFQRLLRLLDEQRDIRITRVRHSLVEWFSQFSNWLNDVAGVRDNDDSFDRAISRARLRLGESCGPELEFAEFAEWWRDATASRSLQRVFGRGGVTVTSLTSMSYAPYEMVCLVGFDEENLPSATLNGSILGERRVGDPDARHALLGAMLASCAVATNRLLITWNERDEESGRAKEPAIPLDELLDAIAASTTCRRDQLMLHAPRHGFAVPLGDVPMISTTYDSGYSNVPPDGNDVNILSTLLQSNPDGVVPSTFSALREFTEAPAMFFIRRVLGAQLPSNVAVEPTIPPVTIDDLRRSTLQRNYVDNLTSALLLTNDNHYPPLYETFDHEPDNSCDGEPCAWLHSSTTQLRRLIFNHERFTAGVPSRLWRRRLQLNLLELAAYNRFVDLSSFEMVPHVETVAVLSDIELDSGVTLSLDEERRDEKRWPLFHRVSDGALGRLRFESRNLKQHDWRYLLRDVAELLVLVINTSGQKLFVETHFLPEKMDSYGAGRGTILKGGFATNPSLTYEYQGSLDEARTSLEGLVTLLLRSASGPVPLFRRTSVAAVADFKVGARAAWTSTDFSRGEDREIAHQLLFPLDFDELATLSPDNTFPLVQELRAILAHVHYTLSSSTERLPAASWQSAHPGKWREIGAIPSRRRPIIEPGTAS